MFHIVDFLVKAARKEHSVLARTVATALGAVVFLILIPALAFWAGALSFSRMILPDPSALVFSIAFFLLGIPWMVWAVVWQLVKGKGTPVPTVPTKNFLNNGPYRFVRNPMVFGYSLYLLGWAFWWDQTGALAVSIAVAVLLCLDIKLIEEKELAVRFGDAYLQYKKETPFIVPRFFVKRET